MSGFTIKIEGLDDALKKLDVVKLKNEIQDEMNTFGANTQKDAQNYAPVDEGLLRSKIYFKPITDANNIGVEVGCAVDYAAYLEFGTRKFAATYVARLPPTWQALAAQYKGKGGGNFHEMVMAITRWVLRKGFAAEKTKSGANSKSKNSLEAQENAAYAIARSILINGIRPHPFLFPAVENNRDKLIDNLRKLLNA